MLKVLQLTTYPLKPLDQGGKIRSFFISSSLKSKYETRTLTFDFAAEDKVDGFEVILDSAESSKVITNGAFRDWGINDYLAIRPELVNKVFATVSSFCPDILLLEQCFLWPLVESMIEAQVVPQDVFVVYSSHNIEHPMKRGIYEDFCADQELERHVSMVESMEHALMRRSDLILAVSESDRDYIKRVVPDAAVYVYRNGHSGLRHDSEMSYWRNRFEAFERNWVYVASWHGPNIQGLFSLIDAGLLDDHSGRCRLWVFGGVCAGLKATYGIDLLEDAPVAMIGPAEQADIDSAIMAATGLILPIWAGGGSNLKTAQALLSNKVVIGTRHAFRGYENYVHDDGVYLTDDAAELVDVMRNTEGREDIDRSATTGKLRWENILADLPDVVAKTWESKKAI